MKLRAQLLAAALWTAALTGLPSPAKAERNVQSNANRQVMDYSIYTGGFKMLSAMIDIQWSNPHEYELLMKAQTDGLLNVVSDWQGTMQTRGRFTEDMDTIPLYHQSVSLWPENTQIKKFIWSDSGALADFYMRDEGETDTLEEIDAKMAQNAVDIMTAALSVMQAAGNEGSCGGQSEVFDGKRRFMFSAQEKGREQLKKSRYNAYEGEAIRCEISITPLGGNWHEKLRGWMAIQDQGRQAGSTPTVWLAKLDDKGPAVPVKLRAKTQYGVFLMHLNGYRKNS